MTTEMPPNPGDLPPNDPPTAAEPEESSQEDHVSSGDPLLGEPAVGPILSAKTPWAKRLPSPRRFVLWNLFCWLFGASALVGGILYTEHVVRPVAETGGTSFTPTQIFNQEAQSQRVFGNSDRINVLVLGIDYNHDNKGIIYTKGARSDTMMVISLSRDAKILNVVSIPRDCQVLIGEGYGYDKINSAYSYGGVAQAKKTVSAFLGIPIQHHIVVKVDGAKKTIDALGGLPIDVEKDLDYDDNWGNLHIHLKKGPQVLNGEQAVGYARFRHDEESDRGRIRRQQQVIRALGSKLKEPALAMRFKDIAQAVKETLETDFNILDMVDLADLYSGFDFKTMRGGAIVGDDAMSAEGVSYILPYAPENERTVRRLLKSLDWVTKSDLRIRVVFKGATPEVAYRLADRLADSGFDAVQVEALPADSAKDTRETHLEWSNKVERLEGFIKAILGSLPEKVSKSSNADDDLVIVVGDREKGAWAELPAHLKQTRAAQPERSDYRYGGDFVPRQLPQSQESVTAPYVPSETPAEVPREGDGQDVTEETYPTVTAPPVEEAPSQTSPDQGPAVEAPPVDAAPQEAPPAEAPSEAPAPAPAPEPAPVGPMPGATPVGL